MKRLLKRARPGLTLIETVLVLALISIVAAIAGPWLLNFIGAGEQINRDAIARTLYLAAQNQLTERRIVSGLDEYRTGGSTVSSLILDEFELGYPDWDTAENDNIRYISKAKGYDNDNPVCKLLSPVVINREVLDNAILIEYNARTGAVLSVFYSEYEDILDYTETGKNEDISGDRPYTRNRARKQGYYGGNGTIGDITDNDDPYPVYVSLHDSYLHPLKFFTGDNNDDSKNILYAAILLPDDTDIEYLTIETTQYLSGWENVGSADGYQIYIWTIQKVSGNTTIKNNYDPTRWEVYEIDGFDLLGADEISVTVTAKKGAESLTPATSNGRPPYAAGISSDGKYQVASARHLYDIRYAADKDFVQIDNIDLDAHDIINFDPIPELIGNYTGTGYAVSNLKVDVSGDAGLFASVSGTVNGLTLIEPSVKGASNAGTVAGVLNGGGITNTTVVSVSPDAPVSGAVGSTGGIAGTVGGGTLLNIQYLAVAPPGAGTDEINPITSTAGAYCEDCYYLSGTPVRPDGTALPGGYNPGAASGGMPRDTIRMSEEFFSVGGWSAKPAPAPLNWLIDYPYQYYGTSAPVISDWPVAGNDLSIELIDGYDTPLDGEINVLYAEIKIPSDLPADKEYTLSIDGRTDIERKFTIDTLSGTDPWLYSPGDDGDFTTVIWVIDAYIAGEGKYELATDFNINGITAKIDDIPSNEHRPYYTGDTANLYGVGSPRHLYNARHYGGEAFEQVDNIDLIGYDFDPITALTGSYTGTGYAVSNLTVGGTVPHPGNAGLFASVGGTVGGTVNGLTLIEPSVKGTSSAGTVAGVLDGGGITNTTVVSVSPDAPVEGGTVGGIAGTVGGGTLSNIQYLAVAPPGTGPDSINPITSTVGAYPACYYLSGFPVRPDGIALPDGYNLGTANGGAPRNTVQMSETFFSVGGWSAKPAPAPLNWLIDYPYQYYGAVAPVISLWPVATDMQITLRDGYDTPPDGEINVLYAEIKVPAAALSGPYTLTVGSIEFTNVPLDTANTDLSNMPTNPADPWLYKSGADGGFTTVIWVIDAYIAGEGKYELAPDFNINGITAKINDIPSNEHKPYHTDPKNNAAAYGVGSPRHLYNARHYGGEDFEQVDDIDLNGYDFIPIPELNGTYTGTGWAVSNLKVNAVGNAGLFASVSGTVNGLTLIEPSVTGTSNAGTVAGVLNGGGITNTTVVSVSPDAPVSGGVTGGIAGTVGGGGTLRNIQYLAVAPPGAGPDSINPITATAGADCGDCYYLSGTPVRPNGSGLYNDPAHANLGTPMHTAEWIEHYMAHPFIWQYWGRDYDVGPDKAVELTNPDYPYPFYGNLPPSVSVYGWPITGKELSIELIDSYVDNSDFGDPNVLYAKIKISSGLPTDKEYTLSIDGRTDIERKFTIAELLSPGYTDPWLYSPGDDGEGFTTVIWVIDAYMADKYELATDFNINGIRAKINGASSNPERPYYTGDTANLYEVGSARHLYNARHYGERVFEQIDDIDLDGYDFIPIIGAGSAPFSGSYHGKGRQISNLTVGKTAPHPGDAGLFSSVSGSVSNLTLIEPSVSGGDNAGALAGTNSGTVGGIAVQYGVVSGASNVGGVVGDNNGGTVSDVYFLSINEPVKDGLPNSPVSGTGDNIGGIAGYNSGEVTRALYLAPAPKGTVTAGGTVTDTICPIVGGGAEAKKSADGKPTCFFLSGNRYTFDNSANWTTKLYNLTKDSTGVIAVLNGGGRAMVTRLIDMEWLGYAYGVDLSDAWLQAASGYPYPSLKDMEAPPHWTVADSPARPDQLDRPDDGWEASFAAKERTEKLSFINGDFEYPFMNPNNSGDMTDVRDSAGNLYWPDGATPTNQIPPLYAEPKNYNDGNLRPGSDWLYYDHNWMQGWYTKPVVSEYEKLFDEYGEYKGTEAGYQAADYPWWTIELQNPLLGAGGNYGRMTRTNYRGTMDGVFAELNAAVQGILYQTCDTSAVQGSELYYSFYHASRTWPTHSYTAEKLSFSLSPVVKNPQYNPAKPVTLYDYGIDTDPWRYANFTEENPYGAPTVIRPCQTDRGAYNGTPATRNTVDYYMYYEDWHDDYRDDGKVSFYDPALKGMRTAYLYDVWIGNVTGAGGYGITFWLGDINETNAHKKLSEAPYPSLDALAADAGIGVNTLKARVIGYWDVPYFNTENMNGISEWKQYYGLYTVPQGQKTTEFGFRSDINDPTMGNYLDGVSFGTPGFVAVDKYIKDKDSGDDVSFVKPSQNLTVDIVAVNYGETAVDNITVIDDLAPFGAYIRYKDNVKVYPVTISGGVVTKGTTPVSGYTVSASAPPLPAIYPEQPDNTPTYITISFDTPLSGVTEENGKDVYHGYWVTFDIQVRETLNIMGFEDTKTLLYYFRNQAEVTYYDRGYPGYAFDGRNWIKDNIKRNASEPVKVSIEPIRLTSAIRTDGVTGDDPLIDGPFTVTLRVEIADEADKTSKATGLINILLPDGFTASNLPSGTVYDGTRITIRDVNLDAADGGVREREYTYTLTYTGNDYGVSLTSVAADYKYLYENVDIDDIGDDDDEVIDALLDFPRSVVGIKVKADDITSAVKDDKVNYIDISGGIGRRLEDYGYTAEPVLALLIPDGSGGYKEADRNSDGNYSYAGSGYRFTYDNVRGLELAAAEGTTLGGVYEIWYQVQLTAFKVGGTPEVFALSSDIKKVTVTVTPDVSCGCGDTGVCACEQGKCGCGAYCVCGDPATCTSLSPFPSDPSLDPYAAAAGFPFVLPIRRKRRAKS